MDFYEAQNRMFQGDYAGNEGEPVQANPSTKPNFAGSDTGHALTVFTGYGVNQARNNGADLEPVPITPVKHQNWPEMQIQLSNGWALTNFGKKMSYDDYLRLLTSSNEKARNYLSPGTKGVAAGNQRIGPSPLNVAAWAQAGPGSQDSNPGGPGQTIGGVTNGGFYG